MFNIFGKNLKYLRTQSKMTQEELATRVGKDYSTIGKWELNQRTPIMLDVMKISDIFCVPLEDLLHKDLRIQKSNKNDLDEILFNKYKELSDDDKELIKGIIETRKKQIDKELGEE